MIARTLAPVLSRWAKVYPVVTLTGPRQSGKTTLCRAVFPKKPYASLEPIDTQRFAREDPRGFLAQFPRGAILDEVQRVPELASYIQDLVDRSPKPGQFILTGSEQFGLGKTVSQSLAGRTAILHLLPPSFGELERFPGAPSDLLSVLVAGSYPRIHDRGIPSERWLADYLSTYVERDVRQVLNIGDLRSFMTFLRLAAGSTAQELNLSRLGADAGVSQPTAKAWLSVLETSFLCAQIPAWHANVRKRLVKAPKLHFYDSGLLCHLLGIQTTEQLRNHPLRGAIFESWVASELLKQRHHLGLEPRMHHFREVAGVEVDLMLQDQTNMLLVEVKSGQTIDSSFLHSMLATEEELRPANPSATWKRALVYAGEQEQQRSGAQVLPWAKIEKLSPRRKKGRARRKE